MHCALCINQALCIMNYALIKHCALKKNSNFFSKNLDFFGDASSASPTINNMNRFQFRSNCKFN